MRFLHLFVLFVCLALPAAAQDKARTILVLDASGSMWGQIDGKSKIEIARTVIGGLLDSLPQSRELGLTAYGHNRKGDCSDIETLVPPGPGTRDAIRDAVNRIRPKGKTPLSAAVIAAAEALKYTEDPATVILVSDGRETCDFDPCAVGKQLAEAGVDFTAHVIGFDVANPADRAQLQCLAENTGGRFLTASNASELTSALAEVAAPPPPPPREVTFAAVIAGSNQRINNGLVWTVRTRDGTVLVDQEKFAIITRTLNPGTYRAEVLRISDKATAERTITVDAQTAGTVLLELPELQAQATLDGPDSAEVATDIEVRWTGPNASGDFLSIARIGEPMGRYETFNSASTGNPVRLKTPASPGQYEIRYVWKGKILARRPIEVTPVLASLNAADSGVAGSLIPVTWQGPGRRNDLVTIAPVGAEARSRVNYSYTRDGNPVLLRLPLEPGSYELRYLLGDVNTVLARRPIMVTPVTASVEAPATGAAGATIQVSWSGPDYENDYIAVARAGDAGRKYEGYTYTREGDPLALRLPAEPGSYEIRYVASQGNTVLARRIIEVAEVKASVSAPATAAAGASVLVDWTGPDYRNDYVAVAEVGAEGRKYLTYTYTATGKPLTLRMPSKPGTYEVRYVQSQGNTVLARQPVEVGAVTASVSAPQSAAAGETLMVDWTGPDYQNDFIAIAAVGARDSTYATYAYTRDGSPLPLKMPPEPGAYEVRYVQRQDNTVLFRQPITITAVDAALELADTAAVGEPLLVQWRGPDYDRDYISVAEVGMRNSKYLGYTYTSNGSPLRLAMPLKPGTYEVRYVQAQGSQVLARKTVTVEPVAVSLSAPDAAKAGEALLVTWQGPDYANDFISVAEVGARDGTYVNYTYTRQGSPLRLEMPVRPGRYEIRYVAQGHPDTVLERRVVEVAPVSATVALRGTAKAGGTALIDWTGPGYERDYVAVSRAGQRGYVTYAYTRTGNPLRIALPDAPGAYELRYVLGQGDTVIAVAPIQVE